METSNIPTTTAYLEMVRDKLISEHAPSATDYRIAKTLGISHASVSKYKVRKGSMDAKTAVKVARYLDLPDMEVIAATEAERARNEGNRTFWANIFVEQRQGSAKDYRK